MGNKVFVTTFLPTLFFDRVPMMSSEELSVFLELNLSKSEMNIVRELCTLYDAKNVRLWLLGQSMLFEGSMPHEELIERIEEDEELPEGLKFFFSLYKGREEQKAHAHDLLKIFLKHPQKNSYPFIKTYFSFENCVRHVMAFLRAHHLRKSYSVERDEIDFNLTVLKSWPSLYQPLSSIWQAHHKFPVALDEAFSFWKFQAIHELTESSPQFSLDHVLSYIIRLKMLEMRHELRVSQQGKILERFAKAVE